MRIRIDLIEHSISCSLLNITIILNGIYNNCRHIASWGNCNVKLIWIIIYPMSICISPHTFKPISCACLNVGSAKTWTLILRIKNDRKWKCLAGLCILQWTRTCSFIVTIELKSFIQINYISWNDILIKIIRTYIVDVIAFSHCQKIIAIDIENKCICRWNATANWNDTRGRCIACAH